MIDLVKISNRCVVSVCSRKRIREKLDAFKVIKLTFKSIVGVSQYLDPMIRGWVRYYGKFKMYELIKVFRLLSKPFIWRTRKSYQRYKTSIKKGCQWFAEVRKQYPTLFNHWNFNQINYIA